MPKDKIRINELSVPCTVGTEDFERERKQNLIIDLEITTDLTDAGRTDNLPSTLDYSKLTEEIYRTISREKPFLIERAAQLAADICLSYETVEKATVSIKKPSALPLASSAEVQISREK